MQGKITKDMLIEDALRLDRNTLKIFTKYGIDACCGSHDTIEAESRKRRVDVDKIITELNEVIQEVLNDHHRKRHREGCHKEIP